MSMDLDSIRGVFFEEAYELLDAAESTLANLSNGDEYNDQINAVFRAIHSIKGGAGSFGFESLVKFAHTYETLLDLLRSQKIQFDEDLRNLLLRANDVLYAVVKADEQDSNELPDTYDAVLQKLLTYTTGGAVAEAVSSDSTQSSGDLEHQPHYIPYVIRFVPHQEMMHFGNDPLLILRELKTVTMKAARMQDEFGVKLVKNTVPVLGELHLQDSYLGWEIHVTTSASLADIKEVFEFVEDDCELNIQSLNGTQVVVADSKTPVAQQSQAHPPKAQAKSGGDEQVHSIRVELDRIDRMVNTVGEMVIKQAMILDSVATMDLDKNSDLGKGLQQLNQYMRELQESVMAIRAQPVKSVFSRIPRLVRELSMELGKDIQLVTSGENTEIDKTVIERLGEPLTHMIRNAIDHGIESPEERLQAGKSKQGTISLSAEHRSGRIVIELTDDGRGINRERVLQKARENGIIAADAYLSGEEIDQLIFHPGFSTAKEVTNISGRGVGMDVVKKSIQNLGGRVLIQSEQGKGCRFVLTLPLTLAVLEGMLVSVGNQCYVIPLVSIIETLRPETKQVSRIIGSQDVLVLRDSNITMLYLHELFDIPSAIERAEDAIVVVVESEGGHLMGVVVDEILGQQQVVIKSIEENYDPIAGISAATILGNGRVALIIDIASLKDVANKESFFTYQTNPRKGDNHDIINS